MDRLNRSGEAGMSQKLGVLGGMGPLATADFFYKLTLASKATRDQDHIETVIYSATRTPDRSSSIMGQGPSPLPMLIEGVSLLVDAGVSVIAIPCNTAHYWHADLARFSRVPILHIAESACEALRAAGEPVAKVGLLATTGTLHAGIYQPPLAARGYEAVLPTASEQDEFVQPAIGLVKAGDVAGARALLEAAIDALVARGATRIVMGCTEIPVALANSRRAPMLVDATAALVSACIAHCTGEPRGDRT